MQSKTVTILYTCFVALLVLGWRHAPLFLAKEYAHYQSPDGRHTLIVFRRPMFFALPGQSGDASGYVVLIGHDGAQLQSRSIAMVQLAHAPQWETDQVSIRQVLN